MVERLSLSDLASVRDFLSQKKFREFKSCDGEFSDISLRVFCESAREDLVVLSWRSFFDSFSVWPDVVDEVPMVRTGLGIVLKKSDLVALLRRVVFMWYPEQHVRGYMARNPGCAVFGLRKVGSDAIRKSDPIVRREYSPTGSDVLSPRTHLRTGEVHGEFVKLTALDVEWHTDALEASIRSAHRSTVSCLDAMVADWKSKGGSVTVARR